MSRNRVYHSVSLLLAAFSLAGCGSNSESTDKNNAALCEELPPLAMKSSYRVGFAQLWEANGPWRNANTASMVDEAAKRGYELVFDPGTKSDSSEEVQRMQTLIDAKVDAIILAPHDETVLAPSVVAARRACIPVFIEDRAVDTTIAIPGTDYVSYVGSDFKREGEMAAEWLIENVPGSVKVIELEGTIGSSPGVLRKQGFDEKVQTESRISILVSESADFNESKGHDVARRLLQENPSANVIYSHNDAMSFGAVTAISELGLTPGKDVIVISVDGTKQASQLVLDGQIAAVIECNPKFGPLAFDTLEAYARGEDVPLRVYNVDRTFDATNAASYLPEAF